MRAILLTAILLTSTLAAASNYRQIQEAVTDDTMLENAGVEPSAARMRYQCSAAVVDTDDSPDFFNCVYVQTDKSLNVFSLEDGWLMSELQLNLANIDGVALQHMHRYSQVQIFSGHKVAALYIHGQDWIDPQKTEAVYQWLIEHGVREREPRPWIGH